MKTFSLLDSDDGKTRFCIFKEAKCSELEHSPSSDPKVGSPALLAYAFQNVLCPAGFTLLGSWDDRRDGALELIWAERWRNGSSAPAQVIELWENELCLHPLASQDDCHFVRSWVILGLTHASNPTASLWQQQLYSLIHAKTHSTPS